MTASNIFKSLYQPPKVFKTKDYAPKKKQFTAARKELAAYAFLCRQQEAREWMERVLNEEFPANNVPPPDDPTAPPSMKKSYKSDLFPVLRDGMKLCKLMNKLKGGLVAGIKESADKPFYMLDNINFFLKACKDLGIPEHKTFLPLDLFDRKNMPKVIYCVHEIAKKALEENLTKFEIQDVTGRCQFDEDELTKVAKELDEVEQANKGKSAATIFRTSSQENVEEQERRAREEEEERKRREEEERLRREEEERKRIEDEQNRIHNEEQVKLAYKVIEIHQETPGPVKFEGLSKAEGVSGEPDINYALCAEVHFEDGSIEKGIWAPWATGDHDWEKTELVFDSERLIKKVALYPRFAEHTGRVWFDKFAVLENIEPPSLVNFVQNPSFETKDDITDDDKIAAHWTKKGNGYLRTDETHFGKGSYSIKLTNGSKTEHSAAANQVLILQTRPAPIIIEAWSKAGDGLQLEASADGEGYGVIADIVYSTGETEHKFLDFSEAAATQEWVNRNVVIPVTDKMVKEVTVTCQLKGATGSAFFDHVTISQNEAQQYVKNPSFESKAEGQPETVAAGWLPVLKGYNRVLTEHCEYGLASIEIYNSSAADGGVAKTIVTVNQKAPAPLIVEGWSKAVDVSGEPDNGYAIVANFTFQDGTQKSGEYVPFSTGTHDWERQANKFGFDKPVKEIELFCQFVKHTGVVYFDNVKVTEQYAFGESPFFVMQKILKEQGEDENNWIQEMQELKRQMMKEMRSNFNLEKELVNLDKKISLLIKNKISVEEVIKHSKKAFKSYAGANAAQGSNEIKKRVEQYQHLFYLLQTEPRYLAKILYLISSEDMDSMLETVILTLYGDAFSPREEFLLLQLMQCAISNEISATKSIREFLNNNTVVAKMLVTYSRRQLGHAYIVKVLQPLIVEVVNARNLDLEMAPLRIYNAHIIETETRTGTKSDMPRLFNDEDALQYDHVRQVVNERLKQLETIVTKFTKAIMDSLNEMPYGLRWICKQIAEIGRAKFPDMQEEDLLKVISYFTYYRFLNPAIVGPEGWDMVSTVLNNNTRKNLGQIAKVLQYMFNLTLFGASDKYLTTLNHLIEENKQKLTDYFSAVIKVDNPQDKLMVDQYIEMTRGTKPVIIITEEEIANTHSLLQEHLSILAPFDDDPLRVIMKSLGPAPEEDTYSPDHEMQLTLINKFQDNVQLELEKEVTLYDKTKEAILQLLKLLPLENRSASDSVLNVLAAANKLAANTNNEKLKAVLTTIQTNLAQLETEGKVSKADNYANIMKDVSTECEHIATRRQQRNNEIARLKLGLQNLRKNQSYMAEQLKSYNEVLSVARAKNFTESKKKQAKATKGLKFSYNKLQKMGVIIDSEVPVKSRRATSFVISSEKPGVFLVKAKVAGIAVQKMEILLDDLLEKQAAQQPQLELDYVTLDVNMALAWINKNFLKN